MGEAGGGRSEGAESVCLVYLIYFVQRTEQISKTKPE